MENYTFRKANENDFSFIADLIIAAEKSNTNKLSYATLFNLTEAEVKLLIENMLKEEIDGCEFSINSYLIAEFNNEPIAGFGAWIEAFDNNKPSNLLKANLINYTFSKESKQYLKNNAHLVQDLLISRESFTLQFEYLFVLENHRNKGISDTLIKKLEENYLSIFPSLKKAQVQVFSNNVGAIKVYKKNGFQIVKSFKSHNIETLDYLPFNEKYLMEKTYN
jgi:ribosomal protein S18 acetylase RimI-like enzyme